MPWVGFEPMISAFEREKTVQVLDRAATVTTFVEMKYGLYNNYQVQIHVSTQFTFIFL
jgi:hypothetical protein